MDLDPTARDARIGDDRSWVVPPCGRRPLSKVVCKTKRIGGGFGGKETRSAIFAAAASVASYCLRRPVKIVLAL